MNEKTALELLEYWIEQYYRINGTPTLDDIKGQINLLKDYEREQLTIPVVAKVLPTDECVEQWWAEGKDQQKGFWQEAPYRTNGDVVEEIKTALKYFIETWQR